MLMEKNKPTKPSWFVGDELLVEKKSHYQPVWDGMRQVQKAYAEQSPEGQEKLKEARCSERWRCPWEKWQCSRFFTIKNGMSMASTIKNDLEHMDLAIKRCLGWRKT